MAKFDVPKTLLTDVHDLLQYDWHSNDNNDSDYKNKLLKILCDRFANGYNSTFVGDLLLQINSFRSRSHQLRFNPFTHDILSHRSEIQPLALSILSYAIFRIQWTKQDQSIIMFGNKGSGKSDIANNYIRAITDCCSNSKIGSMINSIVYFNQMLTCYRTKDNPSSSGCINQYKLHFDVCSGLICSASIRHYLFDRNKLFTLRPACGNFRIFYAVVSALAPTAELSNQQTNPSRYFVGINSVGIGQWPRILVNDNNPPSSIEMIDFRQWHEQFIDALKNCMFSGKDIDFIHDVLIAIVLLGDIQFERMQGDEGRNATYIYNDKIAVRAGKLLGIESKELLRELISSSSHFQIHTYNIEQAQSNRNNLMASLFCFLIDWIEKKVNNLISVNQSDDIERSNSLTIIDLPGPKIDDSDSLHALLLNTLIESVFLRSHLKLFGRARKEATHTIDELIFKKDKLITKLKDVDSLVLAKDGLICQLLFCIKNVSQHDNINWSTELKNLLEMNKDVIKMNNNDQTISFVYTFGQVNYNITRLIRDFNCNLTQSMIKCLFRNSIFSTSQELSLDPLRIRSKTHQYQFNIIENTVNFANHFTNDAESLINHAAIIINKLCLQITNDYTHFIISLKPNNDVDSKIFDNDFVREQLHQYNIFDIVHIKRHCYSITFSQIDFVNIFQSCIRAFNIVSPYPDETCRQYLKIAKIREYTIDKQMVYLKYHNFERLLSIKHKVNEDKKFGAMDIKENLCLLGLSDSGTSSEANDDSRKSNVSNKRNVRAVNFFWDVARTTCKQREKEFLQQSARARLAIKFISQIVFSFLVILTCITCKLTLLTMCTRDLSSLPSTDIYNQESYTQALAVVSNMLNYTNSEIKVIDNISENQYNQTINGVDLSKPQISNYEKSHPDVFQLNLICLVILIPAPLCKFLRSLSNACTTTHLYAKDILNYQKTSQIKTISKPSNTRLTVIYVLICLFICLHNIGLCLFITSIIPMCKPATVIYYLMCTNVIPASILSISLIKNALFYTVKRKSKSIMDNKFENICIYIWTFAGVILTALIYICLVFLMSKNTAYDRSSFSKLISSLVLISFGWWEAAYCRLSTKDTWIWNHEVACVRSSRTLRSISFGNKTEIPVVISSLVSICTTLSFCCFNLPFNTQNNDLFNLRLIHSNFVLLWNSISSKMSSLISILLSYYVSFFVCNVICKTTCRVQLQRVCFALPLILSSPLTLIILIDWTFNCQKKLVVVSDYIHLETVCYKDINKWFLIQFCASWICQIALTIHIWFPNNRKLEKTQRLFAQSISQMGLVDQRLLFTRYADKFNNDEMTYENRKQRCNKDDRQKPHTQRRKSVKAIKTINKPPFIFMCATMWHETEMEMTKLIKSLLRIDQYKQKSESRRRHKRNIDLFEFEVHIWFDDAFMDIAQGHVPNTFVKLLVSLMKSVGRVLYGEEYCIDDPVKIPTPYGGRLIWTLPGKTKVVVHLKDKLLCRHKKRWSQVMYMYYLLTYLMIDQLPDQQGIYQAGSYPGRKSLKTELYEKMQNTYILALDGDVDFQPKSIVVLLDRMRKNLSVGAACGRIHPTGKGPLIWYQRFEYAVGHWLQKAAEHKLGCVLCSPGCFSLFRGSALIDDNVLARYSTRSSEAQHYIQYDQGEDRWLCTLLLQQGYRVEYCAFSNALTHAPESFAEFFNQRRRWMPSTMANILDLLKESNRTIRLNASINSFYIVYQGFLFASTLLGPATIILTIASAFRTIFSWLTLTESYLLACFPALFYMIICFTCKSNTQIKLAALLSSFYAAIMATVLVATTAQIVKSNYLTASSLFLPFIAVIYMITGFLHPDEYSNLIHGILYLLALPSGYLLLVIYSFCSLHIVQWGTRENLHKFESADQPKQSLINMLKNYIYQIQNRYCSSIEGDSGNARPKKDCGHQCNRNLNMCQNCTSSLKNAAGCLSIMADQKSKDFKIDRSLTQSKVISTSAVMHSSSPSDISVPSSANLSKQCDNLNNSSFENTSTLSRKSICSNNTLQVAQSRSVNQLAIVANNIIVPRNYLFNPYWLECDHLLGYGGSNHLNANELYFWQQLIDRYLYPIQLNVEQQINITSQLVTMRNNCCFVVFMVNALWVVIQHQFEYVAMDLDELLLDVGILIGQPPGKHKVQPLGLIYMVCFIITLLLQFYGMLLHRWSTLIEVLANTKLSLFHRYVGKTQPKRAKQDLRKKSTLSTKNLSVGHKVSTANAVSANLLRKRRKNKPRHSTSGTDNEIKDYYESDHFSGSDDQFSYNSYSDSAGYVSTDSSEIVYE